MSFDPDENGPHRVPARAMEDVSASGRVRTQGVYRDHVHGIGDGPHIASVEAFGLLDVPANLLQVQPFSVGSRMTLTVVPRTYHIRVTISGRLPWRLGSGGEEIPTAALRAASAPVTTVASARSGGRGIRLWRPDF